MSLTLRPSCPGMARRLELCVHMSELADLLLLCRRGRFSLSFYQSARLAMTNLCTELYNSTPRIPTA